MQLKGRVSDFVTSYSFRSAFILDFFVSMVFCLVVWFGETLLGRTVHGPYPNWHPRP